MPTGPDWRGSPREGRGCSGRWESQDELSHGRRKAAPDDRLRASRDDNNEVLATDYTRDLKSSKN
jgi:hypothetical protein